MSHASLLVVTDDRPTEAELQEILLPWYEYECTGPQQVVILADGRMLSRYDDELWLDGKFQLPPGAREVEMTAEEARTHGIGYRDMDDAAETNPNARWDWWQIGGRYTGKLAPGDQARWGDLDVERMLAEARDRKGAEWDKAEAEFEKKASDKVGFFGALIQQYEGILADLRADMDANRGTGALYQRIEANPRALRLRELVGHANGWDYSIEGVYTRADHVATAQSLTCWAVVKDGRWYEKAQMGWWGMSTGGDWPESLAAIFSSIRSDQWVTVVDYHIF